MPIKITMPALSPTMTEGNLAKWLKAEGDSVEAGDVIAEIETDKATMEVEAVDEGVLGKIVVAEGTEGVPVNDLIAVLLEDGEDAGAIDGFLSEDKPSASDSGASSSKKNAESKEKETSAEQPSSQSKLAENAAKEPQSPPHSSGKRIFASPLAKRIADEKNVDLSSVKGSGPRGRIIKADVEAAQSGQSTASAPAPSSAASSSEIPADAKVNDFGMVYTEVPNNNIKKITAKRLLESKTTVPHFYLTIDCVLDNLLAARKEINTQADGDFKLSVNDFIVKAAAMAIKAYPAVNVSWTEEATHQFIDADISVAVATPNGLMTPIVKAAQNKGLRQISSNVRELAHKAKDGKLKPEEFMGGSFTISNLGMFGVKEFAAIINPPQSCILAVGAGVQTPVAENGEVKIKTVMSCTLSTDHRTVDGAVGAQWLQVFKQYIENPVSMLV